MKQTCDCSFKGVEGNNGDGLLAGQRVQPAPAEGRPAHGGRIGGGLRDHLHPLDDLDGPRELDELGVDLLEHWLGGQLLRDRRNVRF